MASPADLDRRLAPRDVLTVAQGAAVVLGPGARDALARGHAALQAVLSDSHAHYGINTGFGSLSQQRIAHDQLAELQLNLVRSHAAGVGQPLPVTTVRAMLLLLAASLSKGYSGVRPLVVDAIVDLLNHGFTPVVPALGSVGASGDLAPLAHCALVLLGEGTAIDPAGAHVPGSSVWQRIGKPPLALHPKEGLALLNGTHLMAAEFALLACELDDLMHAAHIAAAMSIDACRATDAFLDPRVYELRRHPGPAKSAQILRELLEGSMIITSHRENDPRVQDPYSIRCSAIVLGTAADAIASAHRALVHELHAVTDNPLVFPAGSAHQPPDIISAGNFHGLPVAVPLDSLAIAVAHVTGVSERRVYHMLGNFDELALLTPYLSPKPGLQSGYMIAQYTAAAIQNEIVGLAAPASVINLTTSAGMEDYNSFGPRSAAKLRRAIDLARHVIAIELVCAAQGIDAHRPLRSGDRVEHAHTAIRARVPALTEDRPPSPDIEVVAAMIETRAFAGTPASR